MKDLQYLFIKRVKKFASKFNILSWHRPQSKNHIISTRLNMWSLFENELNKIDLEIETTQSADIPHPFKKIPLDIFGKFLLDIPPQYPHRKAFFPSMVSAQAQKLWTGNDGNILLSQSLAFVRTMIAGYRSIIGMKIENATILDYGCGWGRLIRLLYKFAPIENIYGVDPWDESIKECQKHNVKVHLALSDWVPHSLPFEKQFNLIFAFSVFSHLSEKTARIVLQTLRKHIADDGLFVITIRPKEYWTVHNNGVSASEMIKMHTEWGFAFQPHNRPPIDGDITYGDTSILLDFLIPTTRNGRWKRLNTTA